MGEERNSLHEGPAHTASELFVSRRRRGDLLFAAIVFVLALFLITQIGEQTRWFKRVPLTLQPRFWPVLILFFLALFSGLYLLGGIRARQRSTSDDNTLFPGAEVKAWLQPVEFALYYLLYAALIPWSGYLIATVVFMPLLGLRVGYRDRRRLLLLALIGFVIVLFFKTGLQVKMPPGQLYESLPPAVRNFMIRNF